MTLLSVQAAQARILSHFQPVETRLCPSISAPGRVLAADILSSDLPLFDNSSVDGFAVIAADLADASASKPRSTCRSSPIFRPASASNVQLQSGEAARIMTGAPIPEGADAVIMVEDTDFDHRGAGIACARAGTGLSEPFRPAKMSAGAAWMSRRGHKVLFTGQRLRPQDLGMLAMLGVATGYGLPEDRAWRCFRAEMNLAPVDQPLEPGKIRDTNSYTLSALIAEAGCEVLSLGIAPDHRDAIKFLFDQAVQHGRRSDHLLRRCQRGRA